MAPEIETAHFRRVLSAFCSGIVVVTASEGGIPVGLTCQSFTSLSLRPPLVAFTVARTSTTWPRIQAAGRFCVNVLGEHQIEVSRRFAVSGADKFAGLTWQPGENGAPALPGALAHIECDLDAVHSAGDHDIAVGAVTRLADSEEPGTPLLYYRSRYHGLRGEAA